MILRFFTLAITLLLFSCTNERVTKPVQPTAKDQWLSTCSGLMYKVINSSGASGKPNASSTVTVDYHGTLEDGKVFDSSYQRGRSATFPLNRVIKGWTEGLQLMSPGDIYLFKIPPNLGYGNRAIGKIPANSTLIFKVELHSFRQWNGERQNLLVIVTC